MVATTATDTTRGLLMLSLLMAMATATPPMLPMPTVLTMVDTTVTDTTRGLLMPSLLMDTAMATATAMPTPPVLTTVATTAMDTATATLPMLPMPTVTAPTTDTITKLLN